MQKITYDLERAAVLRHGTIPQLEKRIEGTRNQSKRQRDWRWFKSPLPKMKLLKSLAD